MSPAAPPEPLDFPPPLHRLCRSLSEGSSQAVVAAEGAAHLVAYVNPAFSRLSGREAHSLIGLPFCEAVPEGEANGCEALLDRVFRTGSPETLADQEHRNPSGARVCWSYAAWAILGGDGRPLGVMVQVTDSTEAAAYRQMASAMNEALVVSSVRQHELAEAVRRGEQARVALESQLLRARKLESLVVLAGGIAHDLNNILTPVIGYAVMARDTLQDDSPAASMLDEVATNANRASGLVRQIQVYAGKERLVMRPTDLCGLVYDLRGMLEAASAGVRLLFDLDPESEPVEADAAQLGQAVLSLVTNAVEATEGGGTITVSLRPIRIAEAALWSDHLKAHLPAGRYAELEVADTGSGMTPEVLDRVFDPFFTTKFTGRGLGLAAVQGIVHGHKGALQVHSEPGRGSTFRLLFPCASRPVAPPQGRPAGAS